MLTELKCVPEVPDDHDNIDYFNSEEDPDDSVTDTEAESETYYESESDEDAEAQTPEKQRPLYEKVHCQYF